LVETRKARFPAWLTRLIGQPEFWSFTGLIVLCTVMAFVSDRFVSWDNISNIGRQVSINAIIATGLTAVIITGGIDLSVGAVMALSMTVIAGSLLAGAPVALAAVAGLTTGLICGAINGLLIAWVRLPAIIVTLAMMEIPRGLALLYTGGYPQTDLPVGFGELGRGNILGLQIPTLVMIAVVIGGTVVMRHTIAGRYFYAIGGNEEASRLSGVPVNRYKLLAYMLSGFTAALAGLVLTSRLMSGQPNAGGGYELDAIAAIVLGGTSIFGGQGSIPGTLIGALTLGVLNNGLNLIGVSPYTQKILKGVIIILAIAIATMRRRSR
jgi:ribose transport system permease protein